MAAVTVYNAFSLPRVASKPPTLPAGVPLQKPFASQRSLQSLAFNPAMDSSAFNSPNPLPFVRPDVPPESDEGAQGTRGARSGALLEGNFRAKPAFRSALEQVLSLLN